MIRSCSYRSDVHQGDMVRKNKRQSLRQVMQIEVCQEIAQKFELLLSVQSMKVLPLGSLSLCRRREQVQVNASTVHQLVLQLQPQSSGAPFLDVVFTTRSK
ncbi:unnamed protein product [Amoebophrya sp. A120]|nr:unnamed protein product [Amoebophrya sp. A120]|eukprot:GSA120T00009166001.1